MDNDRPAATAEVPRAVESVALEHLAEFRVLVLHGPRQAGKSTLLRRLASRVGGEVRNLDDAAMASAAQRDPAGFVASSSRPLFIDEVQRGGDDLVRAVKAVVDGSNAPGQFVLAGSLQFLTAPTLTESLAGRAAVLQVWPFSVGEVRGRGRGLVERVWSGDDVTTKESYELSREAALELVVRGGFPEATRLTSQRSRSIWFRNYVAAVVQRDVREMARVREPSAADAVLRGLAALTGQTLSTTTLADRAGLSRATVDRYVGLLEAVFLVHRLPTYARNPLRRAVGRPKIHLVDTGLAANLVGASVESLAAPLSTMTGPLVETFVAAEIAKQISWSTTSLRLSHLRDSKAGREVDLVVEDDRGRVLAIEVKAAMSVTDRDFRHLRWLGEQLGDDLLHGVVVHLGDRVLRFGDRLTAIPLAALWS